MPPFLAGPVRLTLDLARLRGEPADSWRLLLVVAAAVITLGMLGAIAAATTLLTG